jgi:diguanylate cyclase (GGDEF)-like protein
MSNLVKTNSYSYKVAAYALLFLTFLILLPLIIVLRSPHPFLPLFLFYFLNSLIAIYQLRKSFNSRYRIEYQSQELEEKINLLSEEKAVLGKNNGALNAKIIRYNGLKKVVEELNESLDIEKVANHLVAIVFSTIASNKGTCVLYLVDHASQRLKLFKAKREDGKSALKVKEGDIFDSWVLRHASPLLVEDLKKDFRFDLELLSAEEDRPISSLISSPFASDGNILGVLRLDHPHPAFFNQDDLRFLAKACDLGAVALENAQLFQKTQDLAIHDGLTSLYTKGHFLEALLEECKRSSRHDTVFSLLMLDIDFFKNYNDKFGHTAGDIVLKRLASNLNSSLKESNTVISRFGGEEFCVILRGVGKDDATKLAEQLRKNIEKDKITLRRVETAVTVSIGVAAFPADASEDGGLLAMADKAMYQAKNKGRNRVCCT